MAGRRFRSREPRSLAVLKDEAMTRFAAIGLDHRHIYDLTLELLAAGATCTGYWPQTTDPRVLAGFRERFPEVPEVPDRDRLLDDASIDVVVSAAVPKDRAPLAVEAMRRGKDVLVDKPGIVTLEQLDAVHRTVKETGRIFSIAFTERFLTPSTGEALRLVREGAIGRVIQTVGLGPHRLNRPLRPEWFFDPETYGGILIDIASHQIDQFLVFTDSTDAEIVSSTAENRGTPENPNFQDFGEILLRSDFASGYIRVDWFTPDGLPTWGDGRLFVVGTEGSMELRKYVDIASRPGTDHLYLVTRSETRHIPCAGQPITYFRAFLDDVRNRTETAMPQSHVLTVSRLAIEAQAKSRKAPA
jgi:predicted dehydrogenase